MDVVMEIIDLHTLDVKWINVLQVVCLSSECDRCDLISNTDVCIICIDWSACCCVCLFVCLLHVQTFSCIRSTIRWVYWVSCDLPTCCVSSMLCSCYSSNVLCVISVVSAWCVGAVEFTYMLCLFSPLDIYRRSA